MGGEGEGEGRGGLAASTLRLYLKVHPIIYYCPSRTIIQPAAHICTAQPVIVFSCCVSVLLCLLSVCLNRSAAR